MRRKIIKSCLSQFTLFLKNKQHQNFMWLHRESYGLSQRALLCLKFAVSNIWIKTRLCDVTVTNCQQGPSPALHTWPGGGSFQQQYLCHVSICSQQNIIFIRFIVTAHLFPFANFLIIFLGVHLCTFQFNHECKIYFRIQQRFEHLMLHLSTVVRSEGHILKGKDILLFHFQHWHCMKVI